MEVGCSSNLLQGQGAKFRTNQFRRGHNLALVVDWYVMASTNLSISRRNLPCWWFITKLSILSVPYAIAICW